VNGIACGVRSANKIVQIKETVTSPLNVIHRDGVQVVNDDPIMNFPIPDSKVAPIVTDNDILSGSLPVSRSIERLIEIPIKPESLLTDYTTHT
jgi:hypothetical protein